MLTISGSGLVGQIEVQCPSLEDWFMFVMHMVKGPYA
jgi:hypothetical protein